MHCFKKLVWCKKWDGLRLTFTEVSDGGGMVSSTTPSAGRPIGSKKAKAERLVDSSSTSGIEAYITLMVASLSMNSKETHEIFDARWKEMM
jgi:hypothetical protein